MVFGHYSIRGESGKEPLGALYLARDPESGSSVVIRTLRLEEEFEPRDQAEVRKSFFREAEAAARKPHRHRSFLLRAVVALRFFSTVETIRQ